jgi:type VI secretion system protein ImpF
MLAPRQTAEPRDRLQPSLLDRLCSEDRAGEDDFRGLSEQRLRESVKRDLAWLFNTTNLAAAQQLGQHPEVARSVLNYGLPALAGHASSGLDVNGLQASLRRAILDFEPRLVHSSLQVTLDRDEMSHNALTFTISAELWAQPVPLHILLATHVDLESGTVDVREARR